MERPAQTPVDLPISTFDTLKETKQFAWFGELTYAITEQLSATVGARHFDYEQEDLKSFSFAGNVSYTDRPFTIEETGQSYKAVVSYTPNEDRLFYAQWSEGFRLGAGGFQSNACDIATFTAPDVNSDTSENIEVGAKTSFADNRITFNAALFRVNWDDLPVTQFAPCFHVANAGKAQSEGIELELQGALTENIRLDASASYIDATLEEDSGLGNKGDNLPGSANFNFSIGLNVDFTLASYNSYARIDYAYIGEYYNNIAETGTAAGGFGQTHVTVGMELDQWQASLFANNLTNDNGLTWVESNNLAFSPGVSRGYRIRPRTIGLNLSYQF